MSRYSNEQDIIKIEKTRKLIEKMPDFAKQFFIGRETVLSSGTLLAYGKDMMQFFRYLSDEKGKDIKELTLDELNEMKSTDIENYLFFIKKYDGTDGVVRSNGEQGIKRKYSSLSAFYSYYYKHDLITNNPMGKVEPPKLHKKEVVRLDSQESEKLLDNAIMGIKNDTNIGKFYGRKNGLRNYAIIYLLLGTGLRVSECVGLDMDDLFLERKELRVVRKGGNVDIVFFSDDVKEVLEEYLEERKLIKNVVEKDKNALFLSSRKKRIDVRTVEIMVKEHSGSASLKKITPHKLRSTFGSNLYEKTDGDVILVSKALNHTNVSTSAKYYVDGSNIKKKLKDIKIV